MTKINDAISKLISKAGRDKEILAVILFGSYARGEDARDIDICLMMYPNCDHKKMTDKRIEYSREYSFDIQIYQQLPIYVQMRILKDGKIEHVKDEDVVYSIAESTVREFEYFRPRYKAYLEAVLDG